MDELLALEQALYDGLNSPEWGEIEYSGELLEAYEQGKTNIKKPL